MEVTETESGDYLVQMIVFGKKGKYTIVSICPKNISEKNREFRLKRIEVKGRKKPIWNYDTNWPRFAAKDFARIAMINDQPIIGVVKNGRLSMAIPVVKLGTISFHRGWSNNGYWYPSNLNDEIVLKADVAHELGIEAISHPAEHSFLQNKLREEAEEGRRQAEILDAEMRGSTKNVASGVEKLQMKHGCSPKQSTSKAA